MSGTNDNIAIDVASFDDITFTGFGGRCDQNTLANVGKHLTTITPSLETPDVLVRAGAYDEALAKIPSSNSDNGDKKAFNTIIEIAQCTGAASGGSVPASKNNISWQAKVYTQAYRYLLGAMDARARYSLGSRDFGKAEGYFNACRRMYSAFLDGNGPKLPSQPGQQKNLEFILAVTANNSTNLQYALENDQMEVQYFRTYMEIQSRAPELDIPGVLNPFKEFYANPDASTLPKNLDILSLVDSFFSNIPKPKGDERGMRSLAEGRILSAKANFFLKLVKILKKNYGSLALEAVQAAENIIREILKNENFHMEIKTSAVMSLIWLYSIRSELAEERILMGHDDQYYSKICAAMQKLLLGGAAGIKIYGVEIKINEEEKRLLSDTNPIFSDLNKFPANFEFIQKSFQSIMNGGGVVPWNGSHPHQISKTTFDVLGLLGNNEINLLLSLADNTRRAGSYYEAEKYYKLLLDYISVYKRPSGYTDQLAQKARIGLSQTYLEIAAKIHSRDQDFSLAKKTVEKALQQSNLALSSAMEQLKLDKLSSFKRFKYKSVSINASNTIAWSLNSLSSYDRELGNASAAINQAKEAEQRYRTGLAWLDKDQSLEMNLSPANFHLGIADALQNQLKHKEAITEYTEARAKAHQWNLHLASELGLNRARISAARNTYTRDGHLNDAYLLLTDSTKSLEKLSKENMTPRTRQWERLNARLLMAQLKGTEGYLHIQGLKRETADGSFDLAKGLIDKMIEKYIAGKYSERTLKETQIDLGSLYLAKADLIRTRWQMDSDPEYGNLKKAIKVYFSAYEIFKNMRSRRGNLGMLKTGLGKAEMAANLAQLLLRDGKFEEAFKLAEAEILKVEKHILDLQGMHAPLNTFKAMRLLCWLIGLQGGSYEKIHGEGTARKYFLKAGALQSLILKRFSDPYFLELSNLTRTHLLVDSGNILKAASATPGNADFQAGERTLIEAIKIFEQAKNEAEKIRPDSPLLFLSGIAKNNAMLGTAESQIIHGQMMEEKISDEKAYEAAEKKYLEALKTTKKTVKELLDYSNKSRGIKNFEAAKLGLQLFQALIWATNSLGGNREESGKYYTDTLPEFEVALILNRSLLANDDPEYWDKRRKDAVETAQKGELLGIKLPLAELLELTRKNSSGGETIFIHPEMLFATDSNMWMMRFGYIGNLIGAKVYGEAIREYELTVKKLTEPGIRENEFLADIHSAIADLFCYQVRTFDRARELYTKAAKSLLIFSTRQQLPEGLKGAKLEDVLEELEKCCKDMPAKALNIFFRIKFGLAKLELENWIPHPGNARKQYEEILLSYPVNELVDKMSSKKLDNLIRAHLSTGEVENYYKHSYLRATTAYENANSVLKRKTRMNARLKRYLAQYYLGMGDAKRFRRENFSDALTEYNAGIETLKEMAGRDTYKLLTQLYASRAAALAGQGKIEEAKTSWQEAMKILTDKEKLGPRPSDRYEQDRDLLEKRVKEAMLGIYDESKIKQFVLSVYASILPQEKGNWQGDTSIEGNTHTVVGMDFYPFRNLRVALEYES
ncbi:MAG: hypothetical protein ABIB65_00215, partial [Candidatus Margulisiibacteriota bacterium]